MIEPSSTRKHTKRVVRLLLRHENAILIAVLIVLVGALSAVTNGLTSSRANMWNVLLQSSVRGVASVGQTFVILTAGIDVSVGGVGFFTALLGSLLMTTSMTQNLIGHPLPMSVGIPLMLLAGAGIGTISGGLVSRFGMPPLIVTLGMWEITKGGAFNISSGRSVADLPEGLAYLGHGTIGPIPVTVLVFVVVAVIAYFVLEHTTFGRSVYAVGGNPLSAWLSGISTRRIQLTVYVISGFLAGLAGVLITGRTMSASMRTLVGLELDTIAAVCVGGVSLAGGRGTIIGAIVGVIIIGVINNGMSILGAGPDMQGIVKGSIIIVAVLIDFIRRSRG